MKRYLLPFALMTCGVYGCAEGVTPTAIEKGSIQLAPAGPARYEFATDRYPTQEEWTAAGYSDIGDIAVSKPGAAFTYSSDRWNAVSHVTYSLVTDVSASLTSSIIDESGSALNSGGDSYSWSSFIPELARPTHDMGASISTNNHHCGITGKASANATGSLSLLINWSPLRVWSGSSHQDANDVTLGECETREERVAVGNESGEECPTGAEQCYYEGGGSGGGSGGGGEAGGGGSTCTLWHWTIYESGDGGQTWYEAGEYYEWEC